VRTIEDLDELVALVERIPDLYIRYSAGPEADSRSRSVDYEAEVDLPGWSVTTLGPEPWWPRPTADWVARRVCKYLDLAERDDDRRPWVLVGKVVGSGPDHEPLVVDLEPVGWIGPAVVAEARQRYHARFDVGRDSTGAKNGSRAG
jgi:hypothetical protein